MSDFPNTWFLKDPTRNSLTFLKSSNNIKTQMKMRIFKAYENCMITRYIDTKI